MHSSPRKFVIYTEASVSDPAFVVVAEEIFPDKSPVRYSDFSVLKSIIAQVEGTPGYNTGVYFRN
jgi:hypothetical protein